MRQKRAFSIFRMKWIYLIAAIIIIGGIMSFGLIAFLFLDFDEKSAISMVWMIPPMLIVYIIAIHILLMGVQERMNRLLTGIHQVAEGDLRTQIDMKDAEEFEQVYREFNTMVAELSRTREEMEAFTNEFAHEFKTPIASISGFAKLLTETGDGVETPERMEYLRLIEEQSERLLHLSQNALLLSKVEAMQVVTGRETYDLAEQIRRTAILFLGEIERKDLSFEMPEDVRLPFYGNKEMLEHVWINLLNNACKFTPEGGTVSVEISAPEAEDVCVVIRDSGIGMDEETKAHIFEKYYQNDTVSLTKGSGIGLAIVKRIVELCGGTISVSSRPGKGSAFTVCLPKEKS